MGLFGSLLRMIATTLGLAEGKTQRVTDKMLTSNADTIRDQFRKMREDLTRDYNEMKGSIAELCSIRDQRIKEAESLNKQGLEVEAKMRGAIELYKQNNDESLRQKFSSLGEKREEIAKKIAEIKKDVDGNSHLIETYKVQLQQLLDKIEDLKREEAETVADIISNTKINELNAKLAGLSQNTQTKNLEVIREARQKAKSTAMLNAEISGSSIDDDKYLLSAGSTSKYANEFDEAIKLDRLIPSPAPTLKLPEANNTESTKAENSSQALDQLFS